MPRATLFAPGGKHERSSKVLPRRQRRPPELNEAILTGTLPDAGRRRA